ncbi:MAG: hypothetical protein ACREFR_19100 [Limisphaerales bacterium]
MTKFLFVLFGSLAGSLAALAQMGGPGPGAGANPMEKLFGANPVYSATMFTTIPGPDGPMTVKTKTVFDHENSWTEMNMADVQASNLPPQALEAAEQMKNIGMDEVVTIQPADKQNIYVVYPHIHSYVAMAMPPSGTTNNAFSMQTTKLGRETVDGHPCVKNDVLLTNSMESTDFTVWNATDLNNFPIKISTSEKGMPVTITFQNISFAKPAADLFQPPAHYTRYGSLNELQESVVMNHPGGMPGMPSPSVSPGP